MNITDFSLFLQYTFAVFGNKGERQQLAKNAFPHEDITVVMSTLDDILAKRDFPKDDVELLAKLYFMGLAVFAKYRQKIHSLLDITIKTHITMSNDDTLDHLANLHVIFAEAGHDMHLLFTNQGVSYRDITIEIRDGVIFRQIHKV